MRQFRPQLPHHLVIATLFLVHSIETTLAHSASYLSPSFHFEYNQNLALPAPVTSQCGRIQLKWSRGTNDNGPQPVAPYSLLVYNSGAATPYVIPAGGGPTFDWDVPFAPLTQYQICMFDVNGNTGGCQATYTVIANSTTTTPSCQLNIGTSNALAVSAATSLGALNQYGIVDQCTSLTVSPKGGSAPYTLAISPASHPPYNITSNGDVSWQVSLPVGYKFFLSMSSADGLMWSNGPLTVGGQGPTSCLASGVISKDSANKIVIGGSFAGLVAGAAAGIFGVLLFLRLRKRKQAPSDLYFGGAPYYARDRPLKAPSTIAGSVLAPSSYIPFTPTSSIPLMPANSNNLGLPPSPPPPLPPLVPNRRPHTRQRSNNTLTSTTASDIGSTTTTTRTTTTNNIYQSPPPSVISSGAPRTRRTEYPADIKRPLPDTAATDISVVQRDDAASQVSSSSRVRALPRPVSVQSRAPTYVPRSTPLRGAQHVIDEDEAVDVPPEYGRHTDDPSLNYAPTLSSGNRF